MNKFEAYRDWLEEAKMSDEEREERWRPLAPPISQARWLKIQAEVECQTWDVAVECLDMPKGASDVICGLGYYGKAVQETDYYRLHRGLPWDESGFVVTYRGVDGSDESRFKTKEDAMEYVKERAQWWTSATSAHSDYAHYDLHGFGFDAWSEHQA